MQTKIIGSDWSLPVQIEKIFQHGNGKMTVEILEIDIATGLQVNLLKIQTVPGYKEQRESGSTKSVQLTTISSVRKVSN